MFAGALDEDWVQQHTIFELLCGTCTLLDEEKCESIGLTLRAGALAFYGESTRFMNLSYQGMILAFNAEYDCVTSRE